MASGVGIVKAQPGICSWHPPPSPAGSTRRSVPRSPQPNCPRPGAGVNGASRLLAGYRSRRSSGNRSPLRRGGPRSRAGAGVLEECSGSFAGRLSVWCWLRRAGSDLVPVCPVCPGLAACPVMRSRCARRTRGSGCISEAGSRGSFSPPCSSKAGRDRAATISAAAWASVNARLRRPAYPFGVSMSPATFRPTLPLASPYLIVLRSEL
jgi:hypothetical protein